MRQALADIPIDTPLRFFACAAPAYERWVEEFPELVRSIVHALEGRYCRLIYADNMYAYGASEVPYSETSEMKATTTKGRIRADAARRLMALHDDAGPVQVAIVRGSSFFGPGVEQSALGGGVLRAVRDGKPAPLLGDPGLPHTMTYVVDFARCLIAVADGEATTGQVWHVPNSPTRSLRSWLADFTPPDVGAPRERVAGRFLLSVLGVFNRSMRELKDTLYQFDRPHVVEHARTETRLGLAPTPAATAVAETSAWLDARTSTD